MRRLSRWHEAALNRLDAEAAGAIGAKAARLRTSATRWKAGTPTASAGSVTPSPPSTPRICGW